MAVTENTYERYYREISDDTEDVILDILERLRDLAQETIEQPERTIRMRDEVAWVKKRYASYLKSVIGVYGEITEEAYMRGISHANAVAGDRDIKPGSFKKKRLLDAE